MKKSIRLIALILVISIFSFCAIGSGSNNDDEKTTNNAPISEAVIDNATSQEMTAENTIKRYTLGDTFVFNDIEYTIGSSVSFTSVNNEFSEHNGKPVVRVPVSVKNVGTETKGPNFLDTTFYGSKGTNADDVGAYFDDAVDEMGDMRPGATLEGAYYVLYDGDGVYGIDYDDWISEKITVEFKITK